MGLIGVPEVGVEGLAGSVLSIPQCCRGLINAWLPGVLRTDSAPANSNHRGHDQQLPGVVSARMCALNHQSLDR